MRSTPDRFIKREYFLTIIILCIIACIAGFSSLIAQQENILRKYFIIDPKVRMEEYKKTLSNSLSKYFIRENKGATLDQVVEYVKKYGNTSLFELIFVFKDKSGKMNQISNVGMTAVINAVLTGERVYPVTIDNGKIEGYLMVVIKEAGESEIREGLKKYNTISYSLRFMFFLLLAALATIAFYHNYSAKMKLARIIAETKAANDGLTGLHTHEYFIRELKIEVEKFRIYHTPIALLLLDIDKFKVLNDTYGHPVGDKILEDVSKIIKFSTRATDILGRYGGEEFGVIIPYVDKSARPRNKEDFRKFVEEIKVVSERIRGNVEDYKCLMPSGPSNITLSIGVSFYYNKTDNISSASLMTKADKALYKAKELGRNRVCVDYESSV